MPVHNWSRVPSGLFHHFHQDWTIEIARTLNRGRLPKGLSALIEKRAGTKEADVLTVETKPRGKNLPLRDGGGLVVLEPPTARIVRRTSNEVYARRANRIVVRHHLGRIVSVIEVVSPGNKDSRASFRDFVDKSVDVLRRDIHLLVVDLFAPTARDPFGIHKAIWDEIVEEDFEFPPGKDRIAVSYEMGTDRVAYVEPFGVGDELPIVPLFIGEGIHVAVPLDSTYQSAWNASPEELRRAVETGRLPPREDD